MPTPLVQLAGLDLYRGFVAVGRRMSISLAAQDLSLTQPAISRQVRNLEERLGVKLFIRRHRALEFTPEGARLFRTADAAVQLLQDAVAALDATHRRRPVTITASIGVASLWLLPRLAAFQRAHPRIDVRVAATNRRLDLRADDIDLAIRYAPTRGGHADAEHLFAETIVPVAHPRLRVGPLAGPRGIRAHTLLDFDEPQLPWMQWADRLATPALAGIQPRAMLRFNQYDQLVQAALAGQGIALGRRPLVDPFLADGRLRPLPDVLGVDHRELACWLLRRAPAAEPRPEADVLARWIVDEARRRGDAPERGDPGDTTPPRRRRARSGR